MPIATLTVNPAIDVSMTIRQLVAGKKLRTGDPSYEAGGGGINVAAVVRELGGEATAVYVAGGTTGRLLEGLLKEKGVDRHCIRIEDRTREDITLLEESSGDLYRLVTPGPAVTPEAQSQCRETLKRLDPAPDYLIVSGSLPPDVPASFYAEVITEMKAKGAKIILDTKADILKEAAQEGVFLLKPNMFELRELAGEELREEKHQERAARTLIERGCAEVVVLSLGAAGVHLVTRDLSKRLRAPTVSIKSRVGAGDSMVAGITLALSRDWPIERAVRYGIAAGSAAVMTPGTQLCHREDVERLFNDMDL